MRFKDRARFKEAWDEFLNERLIRLQEKDAFKNALQYADIWSEKMLSSLRSN